MNDIHESDWKKFKGLHDIAMRRFFEISVEEMTRRATATKGAAQKRFGDALEYAQKRRKEAVELFDGMKRSAALIQLARMRREGLVTDEELLPLTEDARKFVQGVLEFARR
jgi:hypothetical protein